MDFRYLGREESVNLDWEDPWYSRFVNKNLHRRYRESISTFLYVEPYEVRAEIIVRPYDLQQWVDLGLEGLTSIPIEMQQSVKEKIAEFVADEIKMTIDGKSVRPVLDRTNFLRRTLKSSTVIEPPEPLDIYSATLGVIFVQPTPGLPRESSITWGRFSPKMERVRAAATDEAGALPFYLTPEDTTLAWKNFLKNPTTPALVDVELPPSIAARTGVMVGWVGALLFAIGVFRSKGRNRKALSLLLLMVTAGLTLLASQRAQISEDRSRTILTAMLKNVYHAFDFREEELIYDTLSQTVSGELLTDIYLETRKGLELAGQGGARVKVKAVDVADVTLESLSGSKGFSARCIWNVNGEVGHWGHIHQRANQYNAVITVKPIDGNWKITKLELLEEQRISLAPSAQTMNQGKQV